MIMETPAQQPLSYQYRCFDRSFRAEFALALFAAPAILTLWIFAAYYFYASYGHVPLPLVQSAAYLTVTFIFILIFYRNFKAISRAGSVIIDNDKIIKKSGGDIKILNCADIRGARRSKIPFADRWLILESAQKIFPVPLYIRGGHKMVEKILGNLEEKGLLKDAAPLKNKLYAASMRFNIRYKLRAAHLPTVIFAATASAALNAVTAAVFWERTMLTTILWAYLNMLLQAEAYFFAEKLHTIWTLKGKNVSAGSFTKLYHISALFVLLLGMMFGIAIKMRF
jgi:uncharacterized membrane protein YhdT